MSYNSARVHSSLDLIAYPALLSYINGHSTSAGRFVDVYLQLSYPGVIPPEHMADPTLEGAPTPWEPHDNRVGLVYFDAPGRRLKRTARPLAGKPGQMQIVPEEAAVIRRIFEAYVNGETPREIAGALNKDGIPAPRGTRWNASTINGSLQRGYGVLHNALYGGRLVWNRVRMIKDPDTGKRVSRANSADQWQSAPAPQLAIVDADTFAAVQTRKQALGGTHPQARRRPRHLLSGLLKCGCCGSGMAANGTDKSGRISVGRPRKRDLPAQAPLLLRIDRRGRRIRAT
jgi:hypothetical protein